jgi:hypothetical protein
MTTYTWEDVGDRPDEVLTRAEKEAIAAEWNAYETNTKPAVALNDLRLVRDAKLAETDWEIVMHKEKGTNIPTALKTYRQSLRDITDTYTSLGDVVWPEKL